MYDPGMYGFPQQGGGSAPPPASANSAPESMPIGPTQLTSPVSAAAGIDPQMIMQMMKYAQALRGGPSSTTQAPKVGMPSDTGPQPTGMVA